MILLVRLVSLFLIAATWFDAALGTSKLGLVSQRNKVRKLAVSAYRTARYREALTYYTYLLQTDSSPLLGERVNLGHVYYRLGQYKAARRQYEQTGVDATPQLTAIAATQVGVLATLDKDTTSALLQFRQALLSDPNNEVARQNYELLKLTFSGKKSARKAVQNNPQPTPKPQITQGQQAEKTDQQRDRLTRSRQTTLTDEQARQVLDALQADDLPFELARRRASQQTSTGKTGRW